MNKNNIITDFMRGEIVYERDSVYGPRRQPHWQLVYVFAGRAEVFLDDEPAYTVEGGQVTLLRPGRRERFQFAAGTRHGWCCAEPGSLPEAFGSANQGKEGVQTFTPGMRMLDRLLCVGAGGEGGLSGPARRLAARALFAEYLEQDRPREDPPSHPAVERAERRMREGLAEELDLADLAASAGVTPAHLIRLYRDRFGITPVRRLWRLRLERAEELLRGSGLTVAEVADRCGFANPQHFSKAFVRRFRETPRRYRLRAWEGKPLEMR